jgi:uncharacterized membrane protein YqjE
MAAGDRSLSDVFQDIIRNVQEIVRSEVRLAKTEIREEAVKAKGPTLLLGAGVAIALFAMLFLLLTIVYALALVMPSWEAALIVGAVLAVVASVMLTAGKRRFTQIHPTPHVRSKS